MLGKVFVLAAVLTLTLTACSGTLSAEQKRLLAFGAVLSQTNGMDFDELSPDIPGDAVKEALEASWCIKDHDTAKTVLNWLLTEGSRAVDDEYYNADELLAVVSGRVELDADGRDYLADQFVRYDACVHLFTAEYGYSNAQLVAIETVAAWDYDRLVTLARWCYGADYLSQEEAQAYLTQAAGAAVESYGSWEEYFAGAVLGKALSPGGQAIDKAIADALLKDDGSIYKKVGFAA